MASARGEKPKPNIDEVTKELSMLQDTRGQVYRNKNVFMRAINKEKHFQQVVGGFIQGYELDNNLLENEFDMAEGLLIVQCDTKTSVPTQHPATFFKLQAMAGKTTAERIFEHSMKLRGSKAVATSYLIAYCVKLKRWIICYEKLTGYLEDNIKSLEPFYDVDNEMSHYWQNQLREIITALSDMGVSGTFHGGMSTPQNYTISSSGDIKLIGVRRSEEQKTIRDDLVDFEAFLSLKTTASTSSDWKGFKVLISSDAMLKLDTWTGAVLGHSLLLDPEAKRRSYLELYTWTDRIPYSQKIRFCNALWCCLPEHVGRKLAYYISACKICVQVASGEIYDGRIIYMDIIKFVKNLILHGKLKLSDLLGKINDMFPGFMSMAYAVSKFEQSDMNRLFAAKGNKLLYK